MSEEDKKIEGLKTKISRFSTMAWVLVIVGVGILAYGLYQYYYDKNLDLNELGDFLAGSMTAAWSLAGLFFIYVAFLGQKQQMIYQQSQLEINNQDLELNRQEIKQTNETLRLQREEMSKQNITATRHQFENLFFNLIQTHNQIVNDLDVEIKYYDSNIDTEIIISAQGRDVFKEVYNRKLKWQLGDKVKAYGEIYDKFNSEFGHYYRFLYRIIDTVDTQNFIQDLKGIENLPKKIKEIGIQRKDFEVKYEYISFVRALLSDAELELLFLNMLFWEDLKFKPLIEKYCLLKNIADKESKAKKYEGQFHLGAMYKNKNPNFRLL